MLCRSQGCGTEGLFDKTDGFCKRCYEEVTAMEDTELQEPDWDPTGYYRRKEEHRSEMYPYLIPIFVAIFLIVVGRAFWLMFFE